MARPIYLLYAIIAYAIFFATFLYLIGFLANMPQLGHSVDAGPAGSTALALLVDGGLIALFGVQHSVMARQGFKAAWTRIVPAPIERSTYVLASSLVLIALFTGWRPIPAVIWQIETPIAVGLLWGVFGLGWALVLLSTFLISHFELFGLKQALWHLLQRPAAAPRFHTPLLYRLVRHPLYLGFLLSFWATPRMTAGHLLLAAGMTAYILIAIRYEERDLVGVFGDEYRGYQRRVGMLAPKIRPQG